MVPEAELALLRQAPALGEVYHEVATAELEPRGEQTFDPRDGFDESELVALALSLSPELKARRAEIGERQALLIAAGIWPNPDLGLSLLGGSGGSSGTGFALDLLFALLRPDERPARRDLAEARIAEIRAEIAADEVELTADVRRSRLAVLVAAQRSQMLAQEAELRDEAFRLVERQRQIGEATALALTLVELDRTGIRRSLREARAAIESELLVLNRLVGLPAGFDLALAGMGEPLDFAPQTEVSDEDIDRRLLAGRFDLAARARTYQVREQELRLAVARQFPRLFVGPVFEREVEGSEALGIGASAELPIFDRNQGEIAERQAARLRARAEYAALLHALRARAFAARAALRRAGEEVEFQLRETLPLVERTEALFQAALRARELTVFEWLAARSRAVQARSDHLDALARHGLQLVELETALGAPLAAREGRANGDEGSKDRHEP